MLEDVNFLAVALGAALAFGLGALWYSPVLFEKRWMAGHGYTQEMLKEMQAGMGPSYAIAFLCWLTMATVLAMIAPHFATGVGGTFHIGLMLWCGFSATVGLVHNRFSDKPISVWVIDAGYELTAIALMSVVIGLWS